jgi:tetratricopeptide (TPR) repeat protein
LLEDGNILYRKNRLQEASHRYQYALKKIPTSMENDSFGDGESYNTANSVTFQQLKFNFLLNLSRCKRKMNVSFYLKKFKTLNYNNFFCIQDIAESIDLATSAIELKPNNYDGYYARAKGLLEVNDFDKALIDARTALEKVKLQQKYQHLSTDVTETLIRLYDELSKKCDLSETLTINESDYRQSIDHNRYDLNHEITDL